MSTFNRLQTLVEYTYERYLPSAFDDSLTMVQKLGKVIEFLNQVIELMNNVSEYVEETTETQNTNIQAVRDDFEELKLWLEGEGLRSRAEEILDQWYEDGTLKTLMGEQVFTQISNDLLNRYTKSEIDGKLASIVSGSPKGTYATLAALQTAFPNGTTGVYVTLDNGNWYYYNNGWVSGGVYQSSGVADGSITAKKLDDSVTSYVQLMSGTGANQTVGGLNGTSLSSISNGLITFTGAGYAQKNLNDSVIGLSVGDKVTIVAKSNIDSKELADYIRLRVNTDSNVFDKFKYLGNGYYALKDYSLTALDRNIFVDNRTLALNGLTVKLFIGKNVYPKLDNEIGTKFASGSDKGINTGQIDSSLLDMFALHFADGGNIIPTGLGVSLSASLSGNTITIGEGGYAQIDLNAHGFSIGDKITVFVKSDYDKRDLESYLRIRSATNSNNYTSGKYIGNGYYVVKADINEGKNFFIDNRTLNLPSLVVTLYIGKNAAPRVMSNASSGGGSGETTFYVAPDGSDNNDGKSKTTPFATLKKALQLGATNVLMKRGKYFGQGEIIYTGQTGKKLKISPYENNSYSLTNPFRPLIEIVNGIKITPSLDATTNLLKVSFAGNTSFNEVFISKTKPPTEASGIADGLPNYNAGLWQLHADRSLDKRLKPVLTLAECQSTDGSFFYDGTSVFINNFETAYTEFYVMSSTSVLTLDGYESLIIDDLCVKFGQETNIVLTNNMHGKITNVHSYYTNKSNGIVLDNSNIEVQNCYSQHARRDGFNLHHYGASSIINCDGSYNGDDGISHHDGCTGNIIGGRYNNNGKAGIAPTYGARVTIQGAESSNNKYGLYIVTDANHHKSDVNSFGNLYKNNENGLYCATDNKLLTVSDKLIGNTQTVTGSGTIVQH